MRIAFYIILIVLIVFLVNCQIQTKAISYSYTNIPGVTLPMISMPVYIDKDFSKSDKEVIMKVIAQWNYVLNGYIVMHVTDVEFNMDVATMQQAINGKAYLILKIDSNNISLANSTESTNKKTLGMVNKIGGNWMYLVRDNIPDQELFFIILHEMGHLFGAKHTGIYLMNTNYNRDYFQCIDKETMIQVANYYTLSINDLNYCTYK